MANWPNKELIHIIRGEIGGKLIANQVAARTERGNYAVGNRICLSGHEGDSIDEWEEVAAVPTHKLKHLRDMFLGVELHWRQHAALQEVLTYLPRGKDEFLSQAASLARDLEGPRITQDDNTSRRLAILFEVTSSLHASPTKEVELTELACTCADWLYLINPNRSGLDDIEAAAKEIDSIPDDYEKRYLSLTRLLTQTATPLSEGGHGRDELLGLGAYALAWTSRILEENDNNE